MFKFKFQGSISTYLRLFVGLVLAGVAIVYFQQNVDYAGVWQALLLADLWWVAGAVGCMLLTVVGKAVRWQLLMGGRHAQGKDGEEEGKGVRLSYVMEVLLVGIMLNTLFPLRAGDVTRAYIMGGEGRGRSFTMGTVVLEKVLDLIMLSMIFFLLLLQISLPTWVSRQGYSIAIGASVIFMGVLVLSVSRQLTWQTLIPSALIRYAQRNRLWGAPWAQIWSRLIGIFNNGLSSLDILRQREDLLRVGVWSLLIWVISFLTNVFVIWALQLDVPLVAGLLVLVVLQLGLPLASVPGKIGVFEYLCVLSLSIFGVDETSALTFGILLHVIVLVPSLLGLFCFVTLRGKR